MDRVIVEDFYSNREVRFYKNFAPTIRSERLGLKVVEDNERILCGDLQENGIRKSNSETVRSTRN